MATASTKRRRPSPRACPPPEPTERLAVSVPTTALTLAGFREWATSPEFPEHIRAAFMDGEVFIDMSNEEPELHVAVKTEVILGLGPVVRAEKLGKLYGDGLLVTNVAAGVSNNPDASFLSRETIRTGRVRLVPRKGKPDHYREIEGTPDWVLEVISDTSVQKDTEKLRVAYHAAGIPEYWLHRRPRRSHRLHDPALAQGRLRRGRGEGRLACSKVFRLEFRLTRVRDEFGLWEYTLEMRGG